MKSIIIIAILVGVGFLFLITSVDFFPDQDEYSELRNMSIEELEELSVSWYYDDLLRNPEKYKGKIIEFDGKIFRVDSLGKDHYGLIVWVGDDLDQLIVEWKGGRLLDGDRIRGYGVFEEVVDLGSMLADNYYNPKPWVEGIQITCVRC